MVGMGSHAPTHGPHQGSSHGAHGSLRGTGNAPGRGLPRALGAVLVARRFWQVSGGIALEVKQLQPGLQACRPAAYTTVAWG